MSFLPLGQNGLYDISDSIVWENQQSVRLNKLTLFQAACIDIQRIA